MKKFSQFVYEKISNDHDYEKMTLKVLDALLVHHEEDKAEYEKEGKDVSSIQKDIDEIKAAIALKSKD